MGSFYVNITARTSAKEAVNFLTDKGATAYVMPTGDNECVIFEEKCDTQDIAYMYELLIELTTDKNCSALGALNHDSDMLFLMLCTRGELKADYTCGISFEEMYEEFDEDDEFFESDEDAFEDSGELDDEKKEQANVMAQALAEAFEVADSDAIFNVITNDFVFASETHESLVDVLGLPKVAVGLGYNYIEVEQFDEGFDNSKIIKVGG